MVYRPEKSKFSTIKLDFALDHFRPVIPAGWLYAAFARYKFHRKRTNYKKPFFTFLYEASEQICGEKKQAPPGTAYNCKKSVTVNFAAVDDPDVERRWSILLPIGGIVLLFITLVLK
jgi:hypothetical protein